MYQLLRKNAVSPDQVERTIEGINSLVDLSSKRYGRLLNWQNHPDPFWHYGIGLSNTHIFDTGQGLRPFERHEAKYVIGIDHITFSPDQTIKRLKHSLRVFSTWEYNLFGWNCEHLGRLIATDKAQCYQSNPIWWLCNMTPDGEHKTAQQILHDYLSKIDPALLVVEGVFRPC